jgi:hypothetical protein
MYTPQKLTTLNTAISADDQDVLLILSKNKNSNIQASKLFFEPLQILVDIIDNIVLKYDIIFADSISVSNSFSFNNTQITSLTSLNALNITKTSQLSGRIDSIVIPDISILTETPILSSFSNIRTQVDDLSGL